MDHDELRRAFATVTTDHLADACVRAEVPLRCAPPPMRAVVAGARMAGRVLPARHSGSVDIFLEALEGAEPGDVLVVDNGGRQDEACVGDLIALEAQAAGLDGIVIWGLHRDTTDIRALNLPVFSMGAVPNGPRRVDPRADDALGSAIFGDFSVTAQDVVLGDEDGVLFLPEARAEEVFEVAETIRDTELLQAERIHEGETLRDQMQFEAYLIQREQDPSLTFRAHLRAIGAAIEE